MQDRSLERRLDALETRVAVSELRSKYGWYTVRGQRDAVVDLFTDDGVFENSRNASDGPVVVRGKAALREYFARMKPARRVPLVTNEVTQVDGDIAAGTCAMVSFGDDSFCGHYVDHFRKVDGHWLFSRRQFFPYWPIYRPSSERAHP
jgi:ketosteroid isomerase-like protein